MAGSEFVEVLVGVGSARIRDLFMRAKVSMMPKFIICRTMTCSYKCFSWLTGFLSSPSFVLHGILFDFLSVSEKE